MSINTSKPTANDLINRLIELVIRRGDDLAKTEIVIGFCQDESGRFELVASIKQKLFDARPQPIDQVAFRRVGSNHSVDRFQTIPNWNGRDLLFKGEIVKRYRNPGPNQQIVLDHFELEGWPQRIANPLCATETIDARSRLVDTIKSLNRNHRAPFIKFRGDGTGEGIIWEPEA